MFTKATLRLNSKLIEMAQYHRGWCFKLKDIEQNGMFGSFLHLYGMFGSPLHLSFLQKCKHLVSICLPLCKLLLYRVQLLFSFFRRLPTITRLLFHQILLHIINRIMFVLWRNFKSYNNSLLLPNTEKKYFVH